MQIDLSGKRALVCGSTQGIGRAIAMQLAESGAHVTLLARNEDRLKKVMAELNGDKGQIHSYRSADFSNNSDVLKVVSELLEDGSFDILVNNTGGPPAGTAIDADPEHYLSAFKLHLVNNQNLAQLLSEGMKAQGFGRIINIISTSVKQPLKGLGVSNTIRGAVANWSKTIATELAPFGITVNNILPGATETERLTSIIANKAQKGDISTSQASDGMLAQIPANRFGKPEELAYAAAFLASDKAAYITGTNVVVDGGRTSSL